METNRLYTIRVTHYGYKTGYYIGPTMAPVPTQSFHDADHQSAPAIWWSDKPGRMPGSSKCERILIMDIEKIYLLIEQESHGGEGK